MKLIKLHKTMKFILLLVSLLIASLVNAVEVNDLYQAQVAVESQSSAQRNVALKKALASVMLKVGGQRSVLEQSEIKQAIGQFNQYLTQYRYARLNNSLYLVASFNEEKINELFQQANLSLWGRLRPQVLIWMVDEQGLTREVIAETSSSSLPNQVVAFSKERGLPLILPLMDFTDVANLNLPDFWGRFSQPIKDVSTRYNFDAILVIRISDSSLLTAQENANDCQGILCHEEPLYALDWSLISEHQQFSEVYKGSSKDELLNQALTDVSEVLYQGYALSTELENELTIEVANIDSLTTFVEVNQFLNDLSAIESVTLLNVMGESYSFKLKLIGSKTALMASLKLNKKLQQYIDPLPGAEQPVVPLFYWSK